jgi:hypothetical protein
LIRELHELREFSPIIWCGETAFTATHPSTSLLSAQDARGWEKVTSNRAQFIVFLGFLDKRYEITESSLKVS